MFVPSNSLLSCASTIRPEGVAIYLLGIVVAVGIDEPSLEEFSKGFSLLFGKSGCFCVRLGILKIDILVGNLSLLESEAI